MHIGGLRVSSLVVFGSRREVVRGCEKMRVEEFVTICAKIV